MRVRLEESWLSHRVKFIRLNQQDEKDAERLSQDLS